MKRISAKEVRPLQEMWLGADESWRIVRGVCVDQRTGELAIGVSRRHGLHGIPTEDLSESDGPRVLRFRDHDEVVLVQDSS